MENDLILLTDFFQYSSAELDFIVSLENEGLIETKVYDDQTYISVSQLDELEAFTRLYYDLSINIEGIDVIHNLLQKIRNMEQELTFLKRNLQQISPLDNDIFEDYALSE